MKKSNFPEIICYILFCVCTIIISCFHEPWFDEFQAWQISKDSIYNILFVIPHTEGHPPLWHLILKCFSFFNVNCEAGIKIPNLLFMFGAVWLLIFKSPFNRIVRLTLPFTYFIFYQYSIINRPYSIFCFALFLAAVFYKERNEHPFKFVFALALLCLSCAYGMVIASGIIIVWFIQILSGGGISEVIKTFVKDRRFYAMFFIFLLCVGLVFIIYPDKENIAISPLKDIPFLPRMLYGIFVLPADALIIDSFNYLMKDKIFHINLFICILGLFINILFFFVFKEYKKLCMLYILYLLLLCTVLFLHFNVHHIGIAAILYMFLFWCAMSTYTGIMREKLNKLLTLFIIIVIIIQLYWSITASANEIKYQYYNGRDIAEYIKENDLYNYKIMSKWFQTILYFDKKTKKQIYNPKPEILGELEAKKDINFNYQNIVICINPYFNRNIIYSFNINHTEKQYAFFKQMGEDEVIEIKQQLKREGIPDIIINQAELYEIFNEEELSNASFVLLKQFHSHMIWKDKYDEAHNNIYMRKDLYDKLYNINKVN